MKFPEGFVEKYKEILGDEARDFGSLSTVVG
ncbi:NOL1/NOP2/sun family protein [Streptococcus pneumoniae]|nr:NOL1/NOP2/sun family protein [Streptococcus pneumoniae]VKS95654.1 NOL1/NOP2/sun family protein [Streptococcus pneumoniae]